jgi:hypothetical protein
MSFKRVFAVSVLLIFALTTPLRAQPTPERLDIAATSASLGLVTGGELRGSVLVFIQENGVGNANMKASDFEVWCMKGGQHGLALTPVKVIEAKAETVYPGFYTLRVSVSPVDSGVPALGEGLSAMAIRAVRKTRDASNVGGVTMRIAAQGQTVVDVWVVHH